MNKIEAASPSRRAQGDRRPARCSGCRTHPQPAPLVRPADDAGGAPRARRDLLRDRSPAHAAYFARQRSAFVASLHAVVRARSRSSQRRYPRHAGGDHRAGRRLHAAGRGDGQPDAVRASGRHHERRRPAPQDVTLEDSLFTEPPGQGVRLQPAGHRLAHRSLPRRRRAARIPVVGVYETMPMPGYDYQSWMLAEVDALQQAVADKRLDRDAGRWPAATARRARAGRADGRGRHRRAGRADDPPTTSASRSRRASSPG